MATAAPPVPKLDRYVIIHVATTCDEHGVYVTKDSAEVIELGWILLDAKTCDEVCLGQVGWAHVMLEDCIDTLLIQIYRESVLVKPINTPITPLCSESGLGNTTRTIYILTLKSQPASPL